MPEIIGGDTPPLPFRLCDVHVHVGVFGDAYRFDPAAVTEELASLGLMYLAVSSTTTNTGRLHEAASDVAEAVRLGAGRVLGLLWLTPEMPREDRLAPASFGFAVRGLKIHGAARRWEPRDLRRAFTWAADYALPLLLHTGYAPDGPEAGSYEELIRDFPDVAVILAHCRPEDQCARLCGSYPNVFVDTAFSSFEGLDAVRRAGGDGRILFGSDYPVFRHYFPDEHPLDRYRRAVAELRARYGDAVLQQWGSDNFLRLFGCEIV
jgi:predicted TIM-barrel fold metal-dependent hydrolase